MIYCHLAIFNVNKKALHECVVFHVVIVERGFLKNKIDGEFGKNLILGGISFDL